MVCRPVPLCRLIGVVGVSLGYAEHRDGSFALEAAARAAGRCTSPTRKLRSLPAGPRPSHDAPARSAACGAPGQRPLPVPRRWPSSGCPVALIVLGFGRCQLQLEASATGRRWPADLPGLTSKTRTRNAACAKTRGQCAPLLMATRHARSFKLVGI